MCLISSSKACFVVLTIVILAISLVNPLDRRTNKNPGSSFKQFHGEEEHVCSIYIYTDPFLWKQVYKMEGKETFQRRIHKIVNDLSNLSICGIFFYSYLRAKNLQATIKNAVSNSDFDSVIVLPLIIFAGIINFLPFLPQKKNQFRYFYSQLTMTNFENPKSF